MKSNTIPILLVAALFAFIVYRYMNHMKPFEGFCNPDEVRVSGACRKTCFQEGAKFNLGEKTCY
jgi:hypothetical protein